MLSFIYEDDYFVAVDKPAGIVVTKADSVKSETIEDMLSQNSPFNNLERSGIVHRLDKDTSGVLLVAKTSEMKQHLHDIFEQRDIQKTYLALVHGHLETETGTIDAPIMRNPKNREKFTVGESGRSAVSRFEVISKHQLPIYEVLSERDHITKKEHLYYDMHAKNYSYIKVFPRTGRTHQIRVHMQFIHHPLVSDAVYVNRKLLRADTLWCPRHFLHAHKIEFKHPVTGLDVKLESPLPLELKLALSHFTA